MLWMRDEVGCKKAMLVFRGRNMKYNMHKRISNLSRHLSQGMVLKTSFGVN